MNGPAHRKTVGEIGPVCVRKIIVVGLITAKLGNLASMKVNRQVLVIVNHFPVNCGTTTYLPKDH